MARYDPTLPWTLQERPRRGSLSGKFQVLFQLVIAIVYCWYCWRLPPPGKALLWLTLAAVLMTLSQVGAFHKAVWVLLVLVLMFLENKSINQDRREAAAVDRQLVESTTTLVRQVGILNPQVVAADQKVDDLKGQLKGAIASNDKARADDIRKQLAESQQRAETTTLRMLLTMAPAIVAEMKAIAADWDKDDREIDGRARNQRINLVPESPDYAVKNAQLVEQEQKEKDNLNAWRTRRILPLLSSADYLRTELLGRLTARQTEEDGKAATIFAEALNGKPITWYEMGVISEYMAALVRKFPGDG